jgi:hypothetical protein
MHFNFVLVLSRVGIAQLLYRRGTGWMAGVRFLAEATDLYATSQRLTTSGAHPASCPMGPGAPSRRVNLLDREVDHSPPSNPDVKYGGVIPRLPHTS